MKLSNKILLSIFGLVFALIASFMTAVRLDIGEVNVAVKNDPEVLEIPVQAFESVTLSDNVRISLDIGDSYGIKVSGPTRESINLDIRTQVNAGNLEFKFPENYGNERRRHQIRLTTPKVKKIILNDDARLTIGSLDQDSLEIDLSDGAEFFANDLALDYLSVKANSRTRIKSNTSRVKEVYLELNDKSECMLFRLEGGSISGTLEQRALLRLSGWTTRLNVDMDKKARIIKRD